MKFTYSIVFCILSVLLVETTSCNHHIDKVTGERKVQVMQGYMTYYPDSNILIYRNNVGLRMDTEVYTPKPFYAQLPQSLNWYSFASAGAFEFYYPRQQVVAINIDLYHTAFARDTIYEPTAAEVENFINTIMPGHGKYDIRKIKLNLQRKQCIIKKGAATILLYNITPENLGKFSQYLEELEFL